MASFVTPLGTGTFAIQTSDGMIPGFDRVLNFDIEHLPFSDTDIIDIGGFSAAQLNVPIIVLAAAVAGMEACLGQSGTLTTPSFSTTARLLALSGKKSNFDGTHYFYNAQWVKSL